MLIQKLRLQRGWSQEQLAEISGLSTRTIQRLERGAAPSLETLKALGAAFEVDLSTLREPDMTTANITAAPMTTQPGVSADEALALARVRRIKGFYLHLVQYAGVITVLTVMNLATSPRYLWVIWVAAAWGLGLALHGLKAFDRLPFLNAEWERTQVEKQLGRKL
ncbi:helix-turn-helix domain-containing protein [Bradyrhizobium sp. STM 3809]|uniref:helix-turn-helix domain-containing protein n=1 Tax=Bradyrhizobium sp. STM 3809 TaxID=551936 RepID=UPI000240A363|nr:helix-turn-helix domain-containing protein [Bradyrhizobium sp. STM 3809]CCE03647.1 conserved hypothetical protein [Bradyrhizobium sp. STM 3809]